MPTEENQDSTIVRGLEPGTTYEVRVVSVDGNQQTPSRIEDIVTGGLGIICGLN